MLSIAKCGAELNGPEGWLLSVGRNKRATSNRSDPRLENAPWSHNAPRVYNFYVTFRAFLEGIAYWSSAGHVLLFSQ